MPAVKTVYRLTEPKVVGGYGRRGVDTRLWATLLNHGGKPRR